MILFLFLLLQVAIPMKLAIDGFASTLIYDNSNIPSGGLIITTYTFWCWCWCWCWCVPCQLLWFLYWSIKLKSTWSNSRSIIMMMILPSFGWRYYWFFFTSKIPFDSSPLFLVSIICIGPSLSVHWSSSHSECYCFNSSISYNHIDNATATIIRLLI